MVLKHERMSKFLARQGNHLFALPQMHQLSKGTRQVTQTFQEFPHLTRVLLKSSWSFQSQAPSCAAFCRLPLERALILHQLQREQPWKTNWNVPMDRRPRIPCRTPIQRSLKAGQRYLAPEYGSRIIMIRWAKNNGGKKRQNSVNPSVVFFTAEVF